MYMKDSVNTPFDTCNMSVRSSMDMAAVYLLLFKEIYNSLVLCFIGCDSVVC